MTADLFADKEPGSCIKLELPDAEIYLYPGLFNEQEADQFFTDLKNEISWQQEQITLYGQVHNLPRLTAWHGERDKSYTYSGIEVNSSPWTSTLLKIKDKIENVSKINFNAVLLNLYRNGRDSVAWHADDEPELGKNPVIGSVTLGEARPFQMKHKINKQEKRTIILQHGSFLLMKGTTQHQWLHQIPKSKKQLGERINLTFRVVE